MIRKIASVAFLAFLFGVAAQFAHAGSNPGWQTGYVPPAAEWNFWWAKKMDDPGYTPVNKAGDTMLGPLTLANSLATAAPLILPPGVAPTSPVSGQVWMASSGLFYQIGATTIGPLGQGGGGGSVFSVFGRTGAVTAQTGDYQFNQIGGTLALSQLGSGITNGQLLIGNTTTGFFQVATLTAGANIGIANAPGSITISASGTGGSGCAPAGAAGNVLSDSGAGACVSNNALTFASGALNVGLTGTSQGTVAIQGLTSGKITLAVPAAVGGSFTMNLQAANDTLVGRATTDTLMNKTLTTPAIAQILNGAGTLTLPTTTDTLVGRATTDTLTNKTLTGPTISGGAVSGTFTGNPTFSGNPVFSGAPTFTGTAPSGSAITALFASPPAIGGTAAAAGNFTTLGATGLLSTAAPTAGGANFNLAQGTAPSSPNNGDTWMTSTGLFYRANGTTVGPLGGGGGGGFPSGVAGQIAGWAATGTVGAAFTLTNGLVSNTSSQTVGLNAPNKTVSASCATKTDSTGCTGLTNGDMGTNLGLNGSGNTLTLSAATATGNGMWQNGQTLSVVVGANNWTLTNSSTLTLQFCNFTTTLVAGTNVTFIADADGLHLDCVSGVQQASTTAIGGVSMGTANALAKFGANNLANSALSDNGTTVATSEALSGTWNFTGTLQASGNTMTFPGSAATLAALTVADQTISGGANVTSLADSAGGITVDCGLRPVQYIPNTGAFTITAPANDGYCYLDVENGSGAGAITLSGFSPNTMGGATVDTTNGHNFRLAISRVHGHSNIFAIALQ